MAQSCVPSQACVVSIVRMPINIVLQNKKRKMNLAKHEILRVDEEIDRRVYVLYGLSADEIRIVEGKE